MRIYYDTEFVENGTTIDLISIGMVAEDGRTYYAISADYDRAAAEAHPFVSKNVLPFLGDDDPKPREIIRQEITEFLRPPPGDTTPTRLWAWYGSYDHIALSQLFGTMMDLPAHVPAWTNDVRQEIDRRSIQGWPHQSHGKHNALQDAQHTLLLHRFTESV